MESKLINADCMEVLPKLKDCAVNCTLTDIPYGVVSREDNGLRNLDKSNADIETFELDTFLKQVHRVTSDIIIIFCAKEQLSQIYKFFAKQKGTVRQGIWQKSNPMPSNGQYVYLSGIENFVWFRKPKGTFNAHCKNPVLVHPNGSSKIHPTEKNHQLLQELILDNTDEGQLILDPCMGSGSTGIVANKLGRRFIGIELDENYFNIAKERIAEQSEK